MTAIIPAHRRLESLLRTIIAVSQCDPAPSEILVHVDGGEPGIIATLASHFPAVKVLHSSTLLGPGGSRNQLITAAINELVANFDDDSFPAHRDYFAKVVETASSFPDVAVFSSQITTAAPGKDDDLIEAPPALWEIPMFSGCGCVFRKSWIQRTTGFVPIPTSYFMEEADLSLQLHAIAGLIVHTNQLKVCHLNTREGTPNSVITSYSIANIVLLGYLRYPPILWPLVPIQVLSRILWLSKRGWFRGIGQGLRLIPSHIARYKRYRHPVAARDVLCWLIKRRRPEPEVSLIQATRLTTV